MLTHENATAQYAHSSSVLCTHKGLHDCLRREAPFGSTDASPGTAFAFYTEPPLLHTVWARVWWVGGEAFAFDEPAAAARQIRLQYLGRSTQDRKISFKEENLMLSSG